MQVSSFLIILSEFIFCNATLKHVIILKRIVFHFLCVIAHSHDKSGDCETTRLTSTGINAHKKGTVHKKNNFFLPPKQCQGAEGQKFDKNDFFQPKVSP